DRDGRLLPARRAQRHVARAPGPRLARPAGRAGGRARARRALGARRRRLRRRAAAPGAARGRGSAAAGRVSGARGALRRGLAAALLAAAVAALYAPVRGHDFVNYDDDYLIVSEPMLAAGLSREGVGWALRDASHGNWFPLTRLSYLLDEEL